MCSICCAPSKFVCMSSLLYILYIWFVGYKHCVYALMLNKLCYVMLCYVMLCYGMLCITVGSKCDSSCPVSEQMHPTLIEYIVLILLNAPGHDILRKRGVTCI